MKNYGNSLESRPHLFSGIKNRTIDTFFYSEYSTLWRIKEYVLIEKKKERKINYKFENDDLCDF